MNKYIEVNRLEFVITNQCSGSCKHCSNGKISNNISIDCETGENIVKDLTKAYPVSSIMTFGGEPLLYANTVCKIHEAARRNGIESRVIITNGYFSNEKKIISETAKKIFKSGVTTVLLSVDAFHQESIPIEPVEYFAKSLMEHGFKGLKTHPAWLVDEKHDNPYNKKTKEILDIFGEMGIEHSDGNNIFPAGNAVKYLHEYFPKPDRNKLFVPCGSLPYTDRLDDQKGISVDSNGDINICSFFIGNVYKKNILEIVDEYDPHNNKYTKMIVEGGVKKLYDYALNQEVVVNIDDCYSSCMVCRKIMEKIKEMKI
jgi:MoaA/NifB/PqqE/SkfB family radical SAM enzyme